MFRRWFMYGLLPVLTASLILAGCSKPEDPSGKGAGDSALYAGEPLTLTLLHSNYHMKREALDDIIRAFEAKHSNITVKVKQTNEMITDQDGKVRTELFEGVDLFWTNDGSLRYLSEAGLLLDLSHLPAAVYDALVADYLEATSQWDGGRYLAPIVLDPAQMTLFKPAFEKAGLPLPGPDWTYTDLEEIALQLQRADQEIHLFHQMLIEPILHAYGGGLYDYAAGRWTLDTPENRAAFELIARMVQEGTIRTEYVPVSFSSEDGPALSLIWNISIPEYHSLPMPKGPAGRGTRMNSIGAAVISHTPYPEAALAFLQELLSEQGQTAFARRGVRPVVDYPAAMEAWLDAVGDDAAYRMNEALAGAYWNVGRPPQQVSIMGDLNRFFAGEVMLDDILPELDVALNQ